MIEWEPFLGAGFERSLRGEPARAADRPAPTALDVSVVEVLAAAVAAESTCWTCGAPLDPRVRVTPWRAPYPPVGWRLSVRTKCTGWRRHRHQAQAERQSGDLVFGLLTPKRMRAGARGGRSGYGSAQRRWG